MVARAEQQIYSQEEQRQLDELSSREFIHQKTIEIIKEEGLWDEGYAKLLEQEGVVDRLQEVIAYAFNVMRRPAQVFWEREGKIGESEAQKRLERAIFNFYALTAPAIEPDNIATITSAEKYTGLESLSRQEKIWTSQASRFIVSHNQLEPESIQQQEDEKEKQSLQKIHNDIERWFGPAGLLVHTAVASWAIQATVERMQEFTASVPAEEQTKWQKYLKEINPKQARIWLNLHDMGRLITHDTIQHSVFTHVIAEMGGIPHELFYDYDLPSILQFKEVEPLGGEYIVPVLQDSEPQNDYESRVIQSRVQYINSILEKLEEMSAENPQYENPVAVLFFWLIDAFTKLYDVRSHEPIASFQGIINNKAVKEKFGYFANLQPGDHEMMFNARASYRGNQGANSAQDKINLYYLRQYELAESVFTWIDQTLHIPKKLLWQLILDFTTVTDSFLDQNGDFRYEWVETEKRQWTDVSPEAHRASRKKNIQDLLNQGVPLKIFNQSELQQIFSTEELEKLKSLSSSQS